MEAMGYDTASYIPSELGGTGVDIHHIIGRGRGGKDRIENLMALTREQHVEYGDKNKYIVGLLVAHREFLDESRVDYDPKWFEEMIASYEN